MLRGSLSFTALTVRPRVSGFLQSQQSYIAWSLISGEAGEGESVWWEGDAGSIVDEPRDTLQTCASITIEAFIGRHRPEAEHHVGLQDNGRWIYPRVTKKCRRLIIKTGKKRPSAREEVLTRYLAA